MSETVDQSWKIASCLDDAAKSWWAASFRLKVLGFIIGVIALFADDVAKASPYILVSVSLVGDLFQLRFEHLRSLGQWLRRKLDYHDGLCWPLSETELANVRVKMSSTLKKKCKRRKSEPPYFASDKPCGAQRALENTAESAWWSKHLCWRMFWICLIVMILVVLVSIAVLIAATQTASAQGMFVSRIVTAVIMLIISLGLIRLVVGYYAFSKSAERSEAAAVAAMNQPSLKELDAVKIMNDYHMARAGGPPIPSWLWRVYREELNREWDRYRQGLKAEGKI